MREDLANLRSIIERKGLTGLLDHVRRHGYAGLPALALVPLLMSEDETY